MATMFEPQHAVVLADMLSAEIKADTAPGQLAEFPQDQDQVMQEPSQLVTNLALAQAWSFAGVVADAESPEPVPPETAQPPSQRDTDNAGVAGPQESGPELSVPDTTGSQVNGTEASAPESTPAGLWLDL